MNPRVGVLNRPMFGNTIGMSDAPPPYQDASVAAYCSTEAAGLVSYVQCAAASLVALVLVAISWRNAAASSAVQHRVTLVVIALTTILVVGILVMVPFAARLDRPSRHRTGS